MVKMRMGANVHSPEVLLAGCVFITGDSPGLPEGGPDSGEWPRPET